MLEDWENDWIWDRMFGTISFEHCLERGDFTRLSSYVLDEKRAKGELR